MGEDQRKRDKSRIITCHLRDPWNQMETYMEENQINKLQKS